MLQLLCIESIYCKVSHSESYERVSSGARVKVLNAVCGVPDMRHFFQVRVGPAEGNYCLKNLSNMAAHSVIPPVVMSSKAPKASPTRTRPSLGKSLNDMNTDLCRAFSVLTP